MTEEEESQEWEGVANAKCVADKLGRSGADEPALPSMANTPRPDQPPSDSAYGTLSSPTPI
jgi:hypothetical protein